MVRRLSAHHELDLYTLSSAEHTFCDVRPYVARTFVVPFAPWRMLPSPFGRLNPIIRIANILRLDRLDRILAEQIDRAVYDVVFVHPCQLRQSPALLRFVRTPTVYYLQEPPRWIYDPPVARPYCEAAGYRKILNRVDPLPLLYRYYLTMLDYQNTRRAGVVLVNSYFSRETVLRIYGINAMTCYLGVDSQKFRPLNVPRESYVISVGALTPLKGFDFLIQSVALVPYSKRPPVNIFWNSEQPGERVYLERLAKELDVSLRFKQLVRDDELVELYNRAVVTLYAPVLEPLGLTALESMSCGTPVIGVREGGVRETIADGVTGLLVERDPQAMAYALECFLADPQKIEEFGLRGREYTRQVWTWERTMTVLEQQIEQTANLHSTQRSAGEIS